MDTFGKSSSAIIDYLLTCDVFDHEYCKSLLQRKAKDKAAEVVDSIIGYELSNDQSLKIKLCREYVDYINKTAEKLNSTIEALSEPFLELIKLAAEVPCIIEKSV